MKESAVGPDALARELMQRCEELGALTEIEGQVTRPYGTESLWRSREVIEGWMREAGMVTRTDTVGNLFGRWAPRDQEKTFLIGGHFDSVVDAGKYDGILGILTGLATVQHFRANGTELPFAIEVAAIAEEEGNRFHTGLLGSSAASGIFDDRWLEFVDNDGISLRDVFDQRGLDPAAIASDKLDPDRYIGFIEAHIEQGPVLEQEDLPVGVVSSITGSMGATVAFEGVAGHAGTVPMTMRHDALAAASEFVLAVEEIGRSIPGLVATVGKATVAPGAHNVIPGLVTLSLDVRHEDAARITEAVDAMHERAHEICARRGVTLDWSASEIHGATPCDPGFMTALSDAIAAEGFVSRTLFSGAGHDAITFAHIMPVSMLFVRCKGGISHNPAESITLEDVEIALRVLQRFVVQLGAA